MLSYEQKTKLRSAIKQKDGWWASIFSGPLANRLLEPICEISWITPNLITITSLFIGLIAAWCFSCGDRVHLIAGALLVQLSFTVDCMDGQLARYRQQFSNLGAWLDRVSDRVKDFIYFFSLAWGFHCQHPKLFYIGFGFLNTLIDWVLPAKSVFLMPIDLQLILMKNYVIESWLIFPLAMIAMFAVFLIDYYVNQDMKLETPNRHPEEPVGRRKDLSLLKSILSFGLAVYRTIPILRFNIGEQALLISFFTALNMVFTLLVIFALLGSFYCFYWPVAKLKGFTSGK